MFILNTVNETFYWTKYRYFNQLFSDLLLHQVQSVVHHHEVSLLAC